MNINVASAAAAGSGSAGFGGPVGFKLDLSRGEHVGRVSSEWFSRPDDERFLSLPDLYAAVRARAERATARTLESRAIRVDARRDDPERLELIVPGRENSVLPTHWSFGQLCSLVGAPASYLRELPAPLAGVNLQHGLLSHRAELIKTLEAEDDRTELRAVTGPDYGRIWDHELVAAVMKIAGNGTAEGAQATDLGPDKRDSLRPCPAVDFSRFSAPFEQAAIFPHSLAHFATACSDSKILTSSLCAHVW